MMDSPRAPARRRLRLVSIGLGIALFLWLPFEDVRLFWVSLFGAALCLLAAVHVLVRLPAGSLRGPAWRPVWILTLAGAAAGLGTPLAALLLMAFKSGLHGHGFPDFTPRQVETTLLSAPLCVAGGLLVGLGAGLWARAR